MINVTVGVVAFNLASSLQNDCKCSCVVAVLISVCLLTDNGPVCKVIQQCVLVKCLSVSKKFFFSSLFDLDPHHMLFLHTS